MTFFIFKQVVEQVLLLAFLVINTTYLILLITSFISIRRDSSIVSSSRNIKQLLRPDFIPGISILVPAYNEAKTLVTNIYSLLMLKYPKVEVIVINDGSNDETIKLLKREFKLIKTDFQPIGNILTKSVKAVYKSQTKLDLIVIDKENGGKSDALNCGLNYLRYPYFCCFDADIILPEDALIKLVEPILENPEEVVAVGGMVKVANDCLDKQGRIISGKLPKATLPALQVVEYIRSFLFGRQAFSLINGLIIISGAFGIFSTQLVREVGGYTKRIVSEDMELVMRLHNYLIRTKQKYKIVFTHDPVCWTEVPTNLNSLRKQRNRWQRGLYECLWRYRQMIFNPRYGWVGMISLPYFFLIEFLGAFVEVFGYLYLFLLVILGYFELKFFLLFFSLSILYGIFLSLSSVYLEDLEYHWYSNPLVFLRLLWLALLENLGFRQLLAFWKVQAFFDYLKGDRSWGRLKRTGFR